MKKVSNYVFVLFFITLYVYGYCTAEILLISNGTEMIESEAFQSISCDGVFLPESVNNCADDAFPFDAVIYGFTGSYANTFAEKTRREFVPVDYELSLDSPAFVSPSYKSSTKVTVIGVLEPKQYSLKILHNGIIFYTSDLQTSPYFEYILTEPGVYDFEISIQNDYFTDVRIIESAIEVYTPAELISNSFLLAPGDVLYPIDETETRDIVFNCTETGIEISQDSITAVIPGTYTITATVDCGTGLCSSDFSIEVREPVKAIIFESSELRIPVGTTLSLDCEIIPSDIICQDFLWVSSDPDIISVDQNGNITAHAPGIAFIKCSCFRAEASCLVNAFIPCKEISILSPSETLYTDCLYQFAALTSPDNANNHNIIWSTSNESVAFIDPYTGILNTKNAGPVIIRCEDTDGCGVIANLTVEVKKGVEDIILSLPTVMITGENVVISAVVLPAEACESAISYRVSNPEILSISNKGVLTALAAGKSTVTAVAENGRKTTVNILVRETASALIPLQNSIYINKGARINLADLFALKPASADITSIVFESSNSNTILIENESTLFAISEGVSVITAKLNNCAAQLTVTVTNEGKSASSVSLSKPYCILTAGNTDIITPVWSNGTDARFKRGVWISGDSSIVKISEVNSSFAVKLLGISEGTTYVRFISSAGSVAEIPVTINPKLCESFSFSVDELTLEIEDTYELVCEFSPSGSREILTWSTSDDSVATVSSEGIVKAIQSGSCVINASTQTGKTASCKITVPAIPMVEAKAPDRITGIAGEDFTVEYTTVPVNACPATFDWFSDNENIVVIDHLTGHGTFTSAGETYIHGYANDDSGIVLDIFVSVSYIPVKSLLLSTSSVNLTAGDTYDICYNVYPSNASYSKATFESSDTSIAVVSDNGTITGIGPGNCEIFVTVGTADYEITRSMSVKVEDVNNTEYRALIMGQYTAPSHTDWLPFSLNGTQAVYDTLSQSRIDGKSYSIRFMPNSPSVESFHSALHQLAVTADEDDVTVIYIIAHGHYNNKQGYCFSTSSGDKVLADVLINEVTQISGHVVLCLCTCNSGYILNSTTVKNLKSTFGIYEGLNGTGHLSIITATTDTKASYYNTTQASASYDFFTKAFTSGLGWNMLSDCRQVLSADSDTDSSISLYEIASWTRTRTQYLISSFVQSYGTESFNGNISQYPNSFIAKGDKELIILSRKGE